MKKKKFDQIHHKELILKAILILKGISFTELGNPEMGNSLMLPSGFS